MLPKEHRLSNRADVGFLFKSGKRAYGESFSLSALRSHSNHTRFAVVVSKKIYPLATDRNRIKRLVRESIRQHLTYIKSGFNVVVFTIRKPHAKLSLEHMSREIETLLRRSGTLLP